MPLGRNDAIKLCTDGSGTTSDGPGGWAAILYYAERPDAAAWDEHSGGLPRTTNNLAELRAVEEGLRVVEEGSYVQVITDSRNVIGWLYGFNVVRGNPDPDKRYRRKQPHIAEAVDRITTLITERHLTVRYYWVKGHSKFTANDRCDQLASAARKLLNTGAIAGGGGGAVAG